MKNTFKKFASLTAVALMSLSMATGCAKAETQSNSIYDRSISQDVSDSYNAIKKAGRKAKDYADTHSPKDVVESGKSKYRKAKDKVKKSIDEKTSNQTQASGDADLANLEANGQKFVTVNDNKSTLEWTWTTNKIDYSNLDSLNRAGKATAYLDKNNYGKSKGRESQKWSPTGWHNQKRNQDRGHLIAYTLTFNFDANGNFKKGEKGSIDNPKNLITETSDMNRGIMQDYEEQVRDSIKAGHKVIYEVTPIFRGDELMARGVHAQAISDDKSLNFNVYLFNVSDNYTFDYATGRSTKN